MTQDKDTIGKSGRYWYPLDAHGEPDTLAAPVYLVTINGAERRLTWLVYGCLGKVWHEHTSGPSAGPVETGAVYAYSRTDLIYMLGRQC